MPYIGFGSDTRKVAPHLDRGSLELGSGDDRIIEAVHEGTWKESPVQDWWYGMAEDGVKLLPFGYQVPDDVKSRMEEKKVAIVGGELVVFLEMTEKELKAIGRFETNVASELPA